jgi:AbrB family looped-hinge helix DNA binding protein
MPSATLTTKGQITIRKAIRDALGIKAGDRMLFVLQANGTVVVEPERVDVRSLRGIIKHDGEPVSVDEMNGCIGEAAR